MSNDNPSFWKKQPVGVEEGANDLIKYPNKIPTESYKLPEGFMFENIHDTKELSKFLYENYVEDYENEYRLIYSETFFDWVLNTPKHKEEYSLGLRFNNYLVGYIFGRETEIMIHNKTKRVACINFLCVTKDLRNKRITPILIREITRRFNCNGIFQAVFTAGTDLLFEVCVSRYWHMPINSKKLLSIGYLDTPCDIEIKSCRSSTRSMTKDDLPVVFNLYKDFIMKYKICDNMDMEDFKYAMFNKITKVFVHEEDGKIVCFGSYFLLDTLAIKKNIKITGAYLSISCGKDLKNMLEDLVYMAFKDKCDVMNALDIGESGEYLNKLGFLEGSGELKYYLYNWKSGKIDKKDVFFYMQ
ncbi:hypothetical protein P3W45_000053 [Vairimorpha bombi]|jgi:glycylpeptide N-tetradecanoyltransferase